METGRRFGAESERGQMYCCGDILQCCRQIKDELLMKGMRFGDSSPENRAPVAVAVQAKASLQVTVRKTGVRETRGKETETGRCSC